MGGQGEYHPGDSGLSQPTGHRIGMSSCREPPRPSGAALPYNAWHLLWESLEGFFCVCESRAENPVAMVFFMNGFVLI